MDYIKLGDICRIKTGKLDANASSIDGKYPFFTCSREPLLINHYSYDCECVLVAGNGDLNVKYYCGKFDAYQRTYIIEVINKKEFNTKFIYLLLNSKIEELRKNSIGGVIKYIKLGNLTNIDVPKLTMIEQGKIIDKLFKIKDMIELRKNQIQKFNDLVKSQFITMFKNCNKVKLSEVATITMGQSPSSDSYNDDKDGIPFFQGKADYGDKYTVIKHWTNKPSKLAYKGDVLMSVRAPVGPVNISSCDCSIGRGLCSITSKDDLTNNEFLFNALNIIQDEIAQKGTGSIFKAIGKNDIYNIELPIGTIELQNKFSQIAKYMDEQKDVYKKSLKKLEEIQISLMQKYFG